MSVDPLTSQRHSGVLEVEDERSSKEEEEEEREMKRRGGGRGEERQVSFKATSTHIVESFIRTLALSLKATQLAQVVEREPMVFGCAGL